MRRAWPRCSISASAPHECSCEACEQLAPCRPSCRGRFGDDARKLSDSTGNRPEERAYLRLFQGIGGARPLTLRRHEGTSTAACRARDRRCDHRTGREARGDCWPRSDSRNRRSNGRRHSGGQRGDSNRCPNRRRLVGYSVQLIDSRRAQRLRQLIGVRIGEPRKVDARDRVVARVCVAVEGGWLVDLTEEGVLGEESSEFGIEVAGLGVVEAGLLVPDVAGEGEAVLRVVELYRESEVAPGVLGSDSGSDRDRYFTPRPSIGLGGAGFRGGASLRVSKEPPHMAGFCDGGILLPAPVVCGSVYFGSLRNSIG